jgi:hypothetical protein
MDEAPTQTSSLIYVIVHFGWWTWFINHEHHAPSWCAICNENIQQKKAFLPSVLFLVSSSAVISEAQNCCVVGRTEPFLLPTAKLIMAAG